MPLFLASCGADDAPDDGAAATTAPASVSVPFGLAAANIPDTDSGLVALFDQLPNSLEGQARRTGGYGLAAEYGDLSGLYASLQSGAETEADGATVAASLSRFDEEPGATVEASELDASADLIWLVGSFTDEGGAGLVYLALWGEPDGDWLFSASAPTPEMREALVRSFVEAADASADAPVTAVDTALEQLRSALPTGAQLAEVLSVSDVTVDVVGGPGIPGSPAFEYIELPMVVGGYSAMFRPSSRFSDGGSIELTLFGDTDGADAVLNELLTEIAPDPEMVRVTFDVTDLLDDGRGQVLDPEPDAHFTRVIGRQESLVIGITVFHGADDDRITETRAILAAILDAMSPAE